MSIKMFIFFYFHERKKCDGNEIICEKCNRKFNGKQCLENLLKNRLKVKNKSDTVCGSVKNVSNVNE